MSRVILSNSFGVGFRAASTRTLNHSKTNIITTKYLSSLHSLL